MTNTAQSEDGDTIRAGLSAAEEWLWDEHKYSEYVDKVAELRDGLQPANDRKEQAAKRPAARATPQPRISIALILGTGNISQRWGLICKKYSIVSVFLAENRRFEVSCADLRVLCADLTWPGRSSSGGGEGGFERGAGEARQR